jgi:hypothetical protein
MLLAGAMAAAAENPSDKPRLGLGEDARLAAEAKALAEAFQKPKPTDLTAAVQACHAGETVEIEVLRDGRTLVVKQLLGVMSP